MKKVIFIMLFSVASAVMNSSYAQSTQQDNKPKTRAEVIAELKKARDGNELEKYNSETFPNVPVKSTKTREEVLKELAEYRKVHPFPEYDSFQSGL